MGTVTAPDRTGTAPARWLLPVGAGLLVVAASMLGARALCAQHEVTAAARMDTAVDHVAAEVGGRLRAIGQLGAALTAFEAGSEEVTAAEFARYLDTSTGGDDLEVMLPGLVAVLVIEEHADGTVALRHGTPGTTAAQARALAGCTSCGPALQAATGTPGRLVTVPVSADQRAAVGGGLVLAAALHDPHPARSVGPEPVAAWTVLVVDLSTIGAVHPAGPAGLGLALPDAAVLLPAPTGVAVHHRELAVHDATFELVLAEPALPVGPYERVTGPLFVVVGVVLGGLVTALLSLAITQRERARSAVTAATEELALTNAALGGTNDELAAANQALAAANHRLERSNQELERFAAVVAHDLRSPLTTVRGMVELVRDGRAQGAPARELLDRAAATTVRLAELIEDLLRYAAAGETIGEPVPVALGEVVAEVRDRLAGPIAERGAVVDAAPLPTVLGDRARLVEVVQNLVSNALTHVPEDRQPRVQLAGRAAGGQVELTITDNGDGIPAAERCTALLAFHRGSGTRAGTGTGLGLTTVQRIVAAHDGAMTLDDAPGGGLLVRLTLPAG